jgi:hypothetical protein
VVDHCSDGVGRAVDQDGDDRPVEQDEVGRDAGVDAAWWSSGVVGCSEVGGQ